MAQGHPLAHARVGDGHHAVAAARVVLPEVPAEGVEVRELPAEEEGPQQQGTCGRGQKRGAGLNEHRCERRRSLALFKG